MRGRAAYRLAAEALPSLSRGHWVDGGWRTPSASAGLAFVNPSSGRVEGWVWEAGVEEVGDAVKSAESGWLEWRGSSAASRVLALQRIAAAVRREAPRLAALESLNTGKPLAEASGDVEEAARAFHYCAELAERQRGMLAGEEEAVAVPDGNMSAAIRYESAGVVAAICPWNFPIMMAAWKLAPALGAGCAVVVKPSELTPYTTLALAELIEGLGVLPRGVVNVVTGGSRTGKALVRDRRVAKVSFTGSVVGGEDVMRGAAEGVRPVTLELGGKSAAIVCESVVAGLSGRQRETVLDNVAEWLAFSTWWNAGQVCSSTARVLLQDSIAPEVTDRLVALAGSIRLGGPFDHEHSTDPSSPPELPPKPAQMGPLISRNQRARVVDLARQAIATGARALYGDDLIHSTANGPDGGFFLRPTVLADVSPQNAVWNQEIFGPILHITHFRTTDQAVQLANLSSYGLAGAVFGDETDTTHVARALRAGIVWRNCAQPTFCHLPWGGLLQSGIGREMGPDAFKPFLQPKQLVRWLDPSKPLAWYGTK
jgi:betaine-aldehyde dehydrogenase